MASLPITYGSDNEDVRQLQDLLNRVYGAGLTEDAKYGPATAAAVAASPMPSYTGDRSSTVTEGKRVNANMWDGMIEDWIKKVAGVGQVPEVDLSNYYTKSQSDSRFVNIGEQVKLTK